MTYPRLFASILLFLICLPIFYFLSPLLMLASGIILIVLGVIWFFILFEYVFANKLSVEFIKEVLPITVSAIVVFVVSVITILVFGINIGPNL